MLKPENHAKGFWHQLYGTKWVLKRLFFAYKLNESKQNNELISLILIYSFLWYSSLFLPSSLHDWYCCAIYIHIFLMIRPSLQVETFPYVVSAAVSVQLK